MTNSLPIIAQFESMNKQKRPWNVIEKTAKNMFMNTAITPFTWGILQNVASDSVSWVARNILHD